MKKPIYLVQSCPRDDFKKGAKEGLKCEWMVYKCYCSPVWATASKSEAIKDCRDHNRLTSDTTIFFIKVIYLFK